MHIMLRPWVSVAFVGLVLVCGLAGCGGSGSGAHNTTGGGGGTTGGTGNGGQGGGDTTFGTGCGLTCAQYGADCGMYQPANCSLAYDCGTCSGGLVCGAAGTPNQCGPLGKWRPDTSSQSVLLGDVFAIWGSGPTDIWAGGSNGRVGVYDGTTWQLAVDFGSSEGVTAIAGSGPNNIWIGTTAGFVYQVVGATLVPHRIGLADEIIDIWTGGPSNTWVTTTLTVYNWDGQSWSSNPTPDQTESTGIWGVAGGPKWVVGQTGWLDRSDAGGPWQTEIEEGTGHTFGTVRGVDASAVWAAGYDVMRLDGTAWSSVFINGQPSQVFPVIYGLWPRTKTDLWGVGTGGLLLHGDGQLLDIQAPPTTEDLLTIWGSGPYDIWVGTTTAAGSLLHYTAN